MELRPIQMALLIAMLVGCDTTQPSHVPNPVLLPIEAVKAGTSNLIYGAKRAKVSRFVAENYAALQREIMGQGGPTERAAMDLAGIDPDRQFSVHKELQSNPPLYFSGDIEPLVVALMVHGN